MIFWDDIFVTKSFPPYTFSGLKYAKKCFFGRGSAPDPTGGAYSAPPDPLAGFQGPTSKGRGARKWEGNGRKGEEKERERRWKWRGKRKKRKFCPPNLRMLATPLMILISAAFYSNFSFAGVAASTIKLEYGFFLSILQRTNLKNTSVISTSVYKQYLMSSPLINVGKDFNK